MENIYKNEEHNLSTSKHEDYNDVFGVNSKREVSSYIRNTILSTMFIYFKPIKRKWLY